jgi:hypothetical protein
MLTAYLRCLQPAHIGDLNDDRGNLAPQEKRICASQELSRIFNRKIGYYTLLTATKRIIGEMPFLGTYLGVTISDSLFRRHPLLQLIDPVQDDVDPAGSLC